MRFSGRLATVVALVGIVTLVFPREGYAYLDPGSASYALQMLIALLLGAAFLVRSYWAKLRSFVSSLVTRVRGGESKASDSRPS